MQAAECGTEKSVVVSYTKVVFSQTFLTHDGTNNGICTLAGQVTVAVEPPGSAALGITRGTTLQGGAAVPGLPDRRADCRLGIGLYTLQTS